MVEKVVLVVITAVASAVSAWWAGRLGVQRALDQKRGERAFERRLEWYEKAVRATIGLASALHSIAIGAKHRFGDPAMRKLVDDMLLRQPEMTTVIAEAQMYATRESAGMLARLSRENKQLLEPSQIDESDRSQGFRLDVAAIETAAELSFRIASQLAAEMRKHIGLEPLNEPTEVQKQGVL